MKYLNKYEMFNEAVNFFEKGKFWLINGKKVKVVGSIPQNPQVLKFQEVDETGKPIGKMFVGKKGEVKGWKDPKKDQNNKPSESKPEDVKPEDVKPEEVNSQAESENSKQETPGVDGNSKLNSDVDAKYKELVSKWKAEQKKLGKNESPGQGTRARLMKQAQSEVSKNQQKTNPEVEKRYKELVTAWKVQQKKLGKNDSPGEGTRTRLMNQAKSELNFDETKDVETDLKTLKRTTAYDAVDRLSNLVKGQKVKKPENVIKYLDFIKSKINTGNVAKPSLN
jgi:hypothetical protein